MNNWKSVVFSNNWFEYKLIWVVAILPQIFKFHFSFLSWHKNETKKSRLCIHFDEQFYTSILDCNSVAHHIRNACFWNKSACLSASSMFSQKQFISNTSSYKADFMLFKIIQYFWHHLRFILKYNDLSNGGIIAYTQKIKLQNRINSMFLSFSK